MREKYFVRIKGVKPLLMHAPNGLDDNPQRRRGEHPCLLYTSPSPRDGLLSRMPSSA